MVPEMEYHLNRAIELGRLDSAFVLRARYKLYLHGDLDGMKADLDQLSERGRTTDRAMLSQFTYALMASKPDVGIQALSGKPEPWIGDYEFSGPAPLLLGELLLLQGKLEFAKQQFEFALVELSKRQNDVARDISLMGLEAWLMMRLGRLQDAKNRHRLLLQEIKRPYRINLFAAVSFTPIPLSLLLGQRQDALLLLREAVAVPIAQTILRSFFNLDPRLVKFRRDTEITALLAAREVSSTHK
jgi:tetratricopeptide (TPR) repeat protein